MIREINEETGLDVEEDLLHFLKIYSDPSCIADN